MTAELDHARQLLALAIRDLRALKGMTDAEVFAYEIFGSQAQQAVEKALKAWISALGGEYPFTHDLALLLERLKSLGCDVTPFVELADLGIFAVHFRYDEAGDDHGFPERGEIIAQVSKLVLHVEKVVSGAGG
jgi:HEPN domain-containing protein